MDRTACTEPQCLYKGALAVVRRKNIFSNEPLMNNRESTVIFQPSAEISLSIKSVLTSN